MNVSGRVTNPARRERGDENIPITSSRRRAGSRQAAGAKTVIPLPIDRRLDTGLRRYEVWRWGTVVRNAGRATTRGSYQPVCPGALALLQEKDASKRTVRQRRKKGAGRFGLTFLVKVRIAGAEGSGSALLAGVFFFVGAAVEDGAVADGQFAVGDFTIDLGLIVERDGGSGDRAVDSAENVDRFS